MMEGIQGPQGQSGMQETQMYPPAALLQPPPKLPDRVDTNFGEIVATAHANVPVMDNTILPAMTELLAQGLLKNLKRRIPTAIQVRPDQDKGTFDVKVEFVILRLDEFKRLIAAENKESQ